MPQNPQDPNPQPVPLNYVTPVRPAGGVPFIGQMALGVVAFVLGIILAVLAGAGAAAVNAPGWLTWLVAGSVQAAVIVVAVVVWRRWAWRGFFVGVVTGLLISVGLVLLAAGLCFAMLKGIR